MLPIENQRVKEVINFTTKGNELQFSREIGVSQPRINRLFTIDKRNGNYPLVSFEIVQAIINKFVNISAEWLLTGNGSMLKEPAQPVASSFQHQQNDRYTASLEKQVAQLEKINALQEEKINELKERIEELQGAIKHLEYENSAFQEGLQGRAMG